MSDVKNQIFNLPKNVPVYIGRQDYVVAYAAGKSVLHLGCVDAGFTQQKSITGKFLHAQLQEVAKEVWGVDIDEAGLSWMSKQGCEHLFHLNIENIDSEPTILAQEFDLLLLTEVIEHLNNPGKFLDALRPLFRPTTELLITTPNSTSLGNLLANMHHKEAVHPDHNFWFSYQTLSSLLSKYDFKIVQVALYSQYDYTRPMIGRFLPAPARIEISKSPNQKSLQKNQPGQTPVKRRIKPIGWLYANCTAIFYAWVFTHWPFFADGLIAVVRPVD